MSTPTELSHETGRAGNVDDLGSNLGSLWFELAYFPSRTREWAADIHSYLTARDTGRERKFVRCYSSLQGPSESTQIRKV